MISSFVKYFFRYAPPTELNFSKVVVQTAETTALTYATRMLSASAGRPVMLVGGAGTGKTTIIQDFLGHLDSSWMNYDIAMNYVRKLLLSFTF